MSMVEEPKLNEAEEEIKGAWVVFAAEAVLLLKDPDWLTVLGVSNTFAGSKAPGVS